VQKQGGEVVDLAQKTFCEFTIADHESHFQGSRASLVCDLPLAASSKQIDRKTRVETRGLSPDSSLTKRTYKLGDSPRVSTGVKTGSQRRSVDRWLIQCSLRAPTRAC
jgi:hypothetical protein